MVVPSRTSFYTDRKCRYFLIALQRYIYDAIIRTILFYICIWCICTSKLHPMLQIDYARLKAAVCFPSSIYMANINRLFENI